MAALGTKRWFLKKLNTELTYHPAMPFLSIFPKELKAGSGAGICTIMFTEALLPKAKGWKESSAHQQMNGETKGSTYKISNLYNL